MCLVCLARACVCACTFCGRPLGRQADGGRTPVPLAGGVALLLAFLAFLAFPEVQRGELQARKVVANDLRKQLELSLLGGTCLSFWHSAQGGKLAALCCHRQLREVLEVAELDEGAEVHQVGLGLVLAKPQQARAHHLALALPLARISGVHQQCQRVFRALRPGIADLGPELGSGGASDQPAEEEVQA